MRGDSENEEEEEDDDNNNPNKLSYSVFGDN